MPINWSNPIHAATTLANTITVIQPIIFNYFRQRQISGILEQLAMNFSPQSLFLQRDATGEFYHVQGRDYFQRLQKWIGHREPWRGGTDGDWRIPNSAFHTTAEMDRRRANELVDFAARPIQDQVMTMDAVVNSMMEAWDRDPVDFLYEVMRDNTLLCHDSEPLFSETHVHIDGRSFSNIVIAGAAIAVTGVLFPSRATEADPTTIELIEELEIIGQHQVLIRTRINDLQRSDVIRNSMIICNDLVTWRRLDELNRSKYDPRTTVQAPEENPYFGRLDLVLDHNPTAGTETFYTVIPKIDPSSLEPAQDFPGFAGFEPVRMTPRPLSMVFSLPPDGLHFDPAGLFDDRKVRFGLDGEFAFGPGLPSECVQRQSAP